MSSSEKRSQLEHILDDYYTKTVSYAKTIERLKLIGASRTLVANLPQGSLFACWGLDENETLTIQ